jgi:hypothetical protein
MIRVFSVMIVLKNSNLIVKHFIDLLGEPAIHGGHLGLDDYEGDDAADGQLENQHYPVMARKKDVMLIWTSLYRSNLEPKT